MSQHFHSWIYIWKKKKKKTQQFEKIDAPNVHSSIIYSRQNMETI